MNLKCLKLASACVLLAVLGPLAWADAFEPNPVGQHQDIAKIQAIRHKLYPTVGDIQTLMVYLKMRDTAPAGSMDAEIVRWAQSTISNIEWRSAKLAIQESIVDEFASYLNFVGWSSADQKLQTIADLVFVAVDPLLNSVDLKVPELLSRLNKLNLITTEVVDEVLGRAKRTNSNAAYPDDLKIADLLFKAGVKTCLALSQAAE